MKDSVNPLVTLRSGFAAFGHRNFRLFWIGQLLSLTGTWMQSVAQSWLMLELTDSPVMVGLVVGLQYAPVMFLGLVGGVAADRFDKRRTLLMTQALSAVQALVLGILAVTGHAQPGQLLVLAAFLGVVNAFDMPARQAFVTEMVGRADIMNALALNSSAFNLARILGPALGGLLLIRFEPGTVFLINAATFAPVIAGLLMMRESELIQRPPPQRTGVWQSLGDGLRYVRTTPLVLVPTLLVGLIATFGMNYTVLLSVIARDVLQIGSAGFGLLMAALGIGSVTAAFVIALAPRLEPRRTMIWGAAAFAVLELAFAGAAHMRWMPACYLLLMGVGASMIFVTATANTTIQQTSPDHLRGRVMSVYVTVFSGSTPIGSLVAGSAATWIGAPMAWGVGAILAGLSAFWAALNAGRTERRVPGLVDGQREET